MRNVTIVESNVEPNKEHLWFYNGKLKWFGPNGWEEINPQVLSPTTTPKPVVTTTTSTTTSTPFPTTTTSTLPPTFKLINNTGDILHIVGYGYEEGVIGTNIPPVPNGGSVFLFKEFKFGQFVDLHSNLNYKLGIIVDGKDKGELPHSDSGNYWYTIPQSIFMAATEISVYRVSS